jgi:hypothetical protein
LGFPKKLKTALFLNIKNNFRQLFTQKHRDISLNAHFMSLREEMYGHFVNFFCFDFMLIVLIIFDQFSN